MFEQPKQFLLDEDRGVSPVIGVILMVAITVILAAVIATFVMNMGPSETTMPNSQLSFTGQDTDSDDMVDKVVIEHNGGGAVQASNIQIKASATSGSTTVSSSFPSDITASSTATVKADDSSAGLSSIQIIWNNPDNDNTQTMAEWEA